MHHKVPIYSALLEPITFSKLYYHCILPKSYSCSTALQGFIFHLFYFKDFDKCIMILHLSTVFVALMSNEKHLFICLLDIWLCSFVKCLFKYFVNLWGALFAFLIDCKSYLHNLNTSPFSDSWIAKVFFTVAWLCTLLKVFFDKQKF